MEKYRPPPQKKHQLREPIFLYKNYHFLVWKSVEFPYIVYIQNSISMGKLFKIHVLFNYKTTDLNFQPFRRLSAMSPKSKEWGGS